MAEDDIQSKFNLDVKEAIENALKAKSAIASMGAAENLSGLAEGLIKIAPMLAGVGIAAFALKKTFDLVFEGEQIKSVNAQFELLTKNVGLSGDALKEGLEKAAGGLVATTDLLQVANKAIVAMGSSAEKLPQIMELARKVGVLTGKDVATAFEDLSHAIEIGSQRQLKAMGINIDLEKATKKYAATLGLASSELSEAGKRHAILNEVLEKGNSALGKIDPNIKQATNTWQEIKVVFKDTSEAIATAFEKVAGPTVKEFLELVKKASVDFKAAVTGDWGTATETLKHQSQEIIAQMVQLETNISDVQDQIGKGIFSKEEGQADIENYNKQLNILDMQLKGVQAQLKATKSETSSGTGWHAPMSLSPKDDELNREEILKNAAKFAQQLSVLDKQVFDLYEKNIMSTADVDEILLNKRGQLYEEYNAKKKQIDVEYANNAQRRDELELALYTKLQEDLTDLTINATELRDNLITKSFQNQERAATNFFGKFSAGVKKASHDGQVAFVDWGKTGEMVATTFQNNFVSAFEAVGAGTISVADAMKKAIIGSIGDIAVAKGSELILSSIWPPNPIGIAAGAALVALGGYLHAQAGAIGVAPQSGAGGGGTNNANGARSTGPSYSEISNEDRFGSSSVSQSTAPKRSVTVQIQGHYFETEQTKTRLVEIIREAADATDFTIAAVGGGL